MTRTSLIRCTHQGTPGEAEHVYGDVWRFRFRGGHDVGELVLQSSLDFGPPPIETAPEQLKFHESLDDLKRVVIKVGFVVLCVKAAAVCVFLAVKLGGWR